MERLFVAQACPSKACSSVGIAQPNRNFLAQSSSIGGLCALGCFDINIVYRHAELVSAPHQPGTLYVGEYLHVGC